MISSSSLRIVAAMGVWLLAGCASPRSDPHAYTPANPAEAAGVWVGMDSDGLQFWRLDLRSDGTGYLSCGQEAWGFKAYRVSHWTVSYHGLVTDIEPRGTNAEPIHLRGIYTGAVLESEVGGVNGGWTSSVTLYPETRMEEYNRQARQNILEAETQ